MTQFEEVRARIAQSLIPNGYNIVKGEVSNIPSGDYTKDEKGEWVKVNAKITKSEVMKSLDFLSGKMEDIEDLFKSETATLRDGAEYKKLEGQYNTLYIQYKKMKDV